MLVPKPKTIVKIQMQEGRVYSLRPAAERDVSPVTKLIQNAFEVWKRDGLQLSPMTQTEEQTSAHLLGKGFVAEDSTGRVVGTFSLENGTISKNPDGTVRFVEGDESPISFSPVDRSAVQISGRFLVFKKAAVQSDLSNSGLGSQLYQVAENLGKVSGYTGMVLETVREARWLYDWYIRLGFQPVATHRYQGSTVDTILMAKVFEGGQK